MEGAASSAANSRARSAPAPTALAELRRRVAIGASERRPVDDVEGRRALRRGEPEFGGRVRIAGEAKQQLRRCLGGKLGSKRATAKREEDIVEHVDALRHRRALRRCFGETVDGRKGERRLDPGVPGKLERKRGTLLIVLRTGANRRNQEDRPLRLAVGLRRWGRRIERDLASLLVAADRQQRHRIAGSSTGLPRLRGPAQQRDGIFDLACPLERVDLMAAPPPLRPRRERPSDQSR